MSASKPNWYSGNANRPYPLDDSATQVGDDGEPIPHSILVDAQIRFPSALGVRAALRGLTITEKLATAIVGAVAADGSWLSAIGAITVNKPLTAGRPYPIQPLADGVAGWVVFGNLTNTQYYGKFSTPEQALLLAGSARNVKAAGVTSLAKLGDTALSGLVALAAGDDFEIVKECREIPGTLPVVGCSDMATMARDVIVFRLKNTREQDSERNVFQVYAGPCAGRPESGTCGDPQPIEFIGPVGPDCCGAITLDIRGGVTVTPFAAPYAGIVLDFPIGLSDACIREKHLPTEDGVLPNEYENACSDYSEVIDLDDFE